MRRRVPFLLAAWLALRVCAWAGIPTSLFTISTPGDADRSYLAYLDGQLRVTKLPREVEWYGRPAPGRWYVDGTRIKSSVGGGYLAYNPSAADGRVFLAPLPGRNTEWAVTVQKKGASDEGRRAAVRAAVGPMAGWALSVDGARLLLSKGGARPLEAERIWEHK